MPSSRAPAISTNRSERWRDKSVCQAVNGHDPELWFTPPPRRWSTRTEAEKARRDRIMRENRAKALCALCPVQLECLTYAFDNDEREGIWGGLTPTERGKTPLR